MPNHVFNVVRSNNKKKLKQLAEKGICQFFFPMPEELKNTKSPSERNEELIQKYGYSDWYQFAVSEWGTKWGCYENELNGDALTFMTAWSPFNNNVLDALAKHLSTFTFEWEEEQGFGACHEFVDGEEVSYREWDLPDFISTDDDEIVELKRPYTGRDEIYPAGYYREWDLNHYLGKNYNWAKQNKDEYVTRKGIS
jgi:hypothetical protein